MSLPTSLPGHKVPVAFWLTTSIQSRGRLWLRAVNFSPYPYSLIKAWGFAPQPPSTWLQCCHEMRHAVNQLRHRFVQLRHIVAQPSFKAPDWPRRHNARDEITGLDQPALLAASNAGGSGPRMVMSPTICWARLTSDGAKYGRKVSGMSYPRALMTAPSATSTARL